MFLYVEVLRGLWGNDETTGERLLGAIKATDPVLLVNTDPEYVIEVVVPEMEILLNILRRDPSGIGRTIEKGLARHEAFWGKESRREYPDRFLALGPLAMAAIAHDRGLVVEIKSDYLPPWLVRGEGLDS